MLINVCNNYLNTKIKCDKPSCDDYDIENLISANNDRGFLVYSCINPPINIDFNFTSSIKLSHVIIWPAIGEQKSTGFKLSVNLRNNSINQQLAIGFLEPTDSGIIFCCNDIDVNQLKNNYINFSIKYISGFAHKFVNSTDNLKLTIMKTQKSVAAVKKIEIWGYVKPNSKIHNLWTDYNNKINCRKIAQPLEKRVIDTKSQVNETNSLEIPEEFLDPITCSLMIQPIILPSGKIIDHSTLETYGKNEALWGRQLSDPFTGLRLSTNFRPIYAQALKCRIDKFITDNHYHCDFNNIPRVLGPHRQSSVAVDLTSMSDNNNDKRSTSTSKTNFLPAATGSLSRSIKTSHRIPIIANYSKFNLKPTVSRRPSSANKVGGNNDNNCLNREGSTIEIEKTVLSEPTLIDDNLRNSLNSLLSNLKTLSRAEVPKEPEDGLVCKCCKNNEIKDNCRYKLPCSHVVCRSALLEGVNNNLFCCDKCNINCRTNEIVKIHLR